MLGHFGPLPWASDGLKAGQKANQEHRAAQGNRGHGLAEVQTELWFLTIPKVLQVRIYARGCKIPAVNL